MTTFPSTGRLRELGARLRGIREDQGHTGQDMARLLNWTSSTVSRAETGKRQMSALEVVLYLGVCGATGEVLQESLALVDERDDYRLKVHPDQVPDELRTLIFAESTATAIECYQPLFIPGLAQTAEYARAVFRGFGRFDSAGTDLRVDVRMARKDVLTRINPALCTFFVHENVFRTMVGNPQVMYEQMLQLLFATSRPQCSIRVVPASTGSVGLANGSFSIFRYVDDSPVVYMEHEFTSEFLEDREVLLASQDVLARVANVALSDAESRAFFVAMASEYETQGATPREDRIGGLAEE